MVGGRVCVFECGRVYSLTFSPKLRDFSHLYSLQYVFSWRIWTCVQCVCSVVYSRCGLLLCGGLWCIP